MQIKTRQNGKKTQFATAVAAAALILPQLHDAGNVPRGKNPPDVVEISHENAAVGSAGQSQGGQKLVAFCLSITAGAGNATATAISCNVRSKSI